MAINERDFYASFGFDFDYKNMLDEYINGVMNQSKIEVLTELKTEIEKHTMTSGVTNQGTWNECIACCSRVIQQKIDNLKGDIRGVLDNGNDD